MTTVTITHECINCPRIISTSVERNAFKSWINGTLIQSAFPHLNSTERESLITGFCGACQDDLYDSMLEMQGNYDGLETHNGGLE
jgi:hypothetical protein